MEQAESKVDAQPEAQSNPVQQIDQMEQMKTLNEEEKKISEEIINEIISYLYTNGLILKSKEQGVIHLPTTLYPSPIPRSLFEKVYFYQIAFNKILNKLSEDQKFIEEILEPISAKDNFIQKCLGISKKACNYEHKQKIKLGVFRNDYLYDKEQNFLILTKFNTIDASMGTFTDRLKNVYNYFNKKYPKIYEKLKDKEIPLNKGDTVEKFTESIIEAIKLGFPQQYNDTMIVFVVNKNNLNIFDRDALSNELYDKHKLKSRKLALSEISKVCEQDSEGNLSIEGKKISLFYFCTGNKEEDYPDEDAWKGREMIELSTAIKVPDINTFLTSLKVFQYYLSKPNISMHYCYNELILNDILRFYGGVYFINDMENEKRKELFDKIKAEPGKYILKTIKDQKGSDLTGENLKSLIPEGDGEPGENIKNGVIFEKVNSPEHETMVIQNEKTIIQNSISKYSIYGIILINDKNLQANKSVSFLVRTCKNNNENGCIFEGTAAIDLPCLVDVKVEPNLSHKVEITAEEIQKYLDALKAEEEAKKKAEEEEAKKKAEEEEAKKKAEEEASKESKPEGEAPKSEEAKPES